MSRTASPVVSKSKLLKVWSEVFGASIDENAVNETQLNQLIGLTEAWATGLRIDSTRVVRLPRLKFPPEAPQLVEHFRITKLGGRWRLSYAAAWEYDIGAEPTWWLLTDLSPTRKHRVLRSLLDLIDECERMSPTDQAVSRIATATATPSIIAM